jgi:hypothetical protein
MDKILSGIQAWWTRHKLKTLGLLATIVGAAQANFDQVRAYLKPEHQGWLLFAFGILAALFGFLHRDSDDKGN